MLLPRSILINNQATATAINRIGVIRRADKLYREMENIIKVDKVPIIFKSAKLLA